MSKRVVVAIGGNSLITDPEHQTVEDQYLAAAETDHHIAGLVAEGWDVVITDREDHYTTWIWPLTGDPRPLRARESITLTGGDRIAFGHRELLFESHHR